MKKALLILLLLAAAQAVPAAGTQMTITGTVSRGKAVSEIVTADDKAYEFKSDSKAADEIFRECEDDDMCAVTGEVADGRLIVSVSSVKRVPKVILTIPPDADAGKAGEGAAKKEQLELTGRIMQGTDAVGRYFFVRTDRKSQCLLGYERYLDRSIVDELRDLADSKTEFVLKGTLMTLKNGAKCFDTAQPIHVME